MGDVTPVSVEDVIARWRRGGPIGAEHIEALAAEVERLRAALERIAVAVHPQHASGGLLPRSALEMRRIARAALDG